MEPTTLQTTWYVLVGAVWVLYLVLGGADLGIGQLVRRVDRRSALRSIGPTWAANDVWLIIAVALMLGAFPGWYASMLSGAYVPFIVLVAAIMLRHAGMELVGHATERSQPRWERVIVAGSLAVPFMWGLIWAGAIDGTLAAGQADGGLGLFTPTGMIVGAALAALCRVQGIAYLRLRVPAQRNELALAPAAAVAAGLLAAATLVLSGTAAPGVAAGPLSAVFALLAIGGLAMLVRGAARGAHGQTLVGAAAMTAGAVATVLAALLRTPIAGAGPHGVELADAAAGATTLTAMLVMTAVMLPPLLLVVLYAYTRFARPPSGPRSRRPGASPSGGTRGPLRSLR